MTKFNFALLVAVITIISACKNGNEKPIETKKTETTQNTGEPIPGFPKDAMIKLMNECTYVDYIFHKLPFSLSQNDDPSINQNISFLDVDKPLEYIPAGCKPDARKFFQIKGDIVYDVDVYIQSGCHFYVFVDKNNKPIYANRMTQSGINFYNNILQQAAGMRQQPQ
jgi:hypothetical protein